MRLLIKKSRLVDYKNDKIGDILIEDGMIKKINRDINAPEKTKVIDGRGKTLMPSFIDTHAHFREPGYEYKETIESGSKAALKGGYTAVLLMGNTKPTASSRKIIEYVLNKSKKLDLIDILQAGTITENIEGKEYKHLDDIKDLVKVVTDDGKGVYNSRVLYEIMKYAKMNNLVVMSHAENPDFSDCDMRLAENIMTYRDLELAKITGCKIHFAHVSTKEAAKRIIEIKENHPNITFEVTPHHIFSDNSVSYRVNPPLREKKDKEYLIESIRNGYVDCIGTDHAPHSNKDKENGSPGISGIEIAFQLLYTKLVKENNIPLTRLSELMSKKSGELLGLNKGKLRVGYDGDLVLIEENKKEVVNSDNFISKGKNNPFNGQKIFGKVVMTVRKGKIMYQQGELNDSR